MFNKKEYMRNWKLNNKDKTKIYDKTFSLKHPDKRKAISIKRLQYKDKRISLKYNPRTGFCSICPNNIYDKSCKLTHIHHLLYDDTDPLKYTIELCPNCHKNRPKDKIYITDRF